MSRLVPCSDCSQWYFAAHTHCPHCTSTPASRGTLLPAAALALGLSLGAVACDGGDTDVQPEYGVAITDTETDDTDDGDTGEISRR